MVNGETLPTDAAVSGSKRRSQSGGAGPKKDGEEAGRAAPLEQVWGRRCPGTYSLLSSLNSILFITQSPQISWGALVRCA